MRSARHAFTIVDALLVVAILGILAAKVVLQFSDASTNAQDGSLGTNLYVIRAQIELYKPQLGGYLSVVAFSEQTTTKTNGYRPYVQSIANNPCWAGGAGKASSFSQGSEGSTVWYYDETTRRIQGEPQQTCRRGSVPKDALG